MKFRPYQIEAMGAVNDSFRRVKRSLLIAPTGVGKTTMFCGHLASVDPRHLIVAHREELIWQAQRAVEKICNHPCGIEMGSWSTAADDLCDPPRTVVTTVQTQIARSGSGDARMELFDPNRFSRVVIDEAHRAVTPSYQTVVDHYMQNDNCRLLGVTATPARHDEKALGQLFDEVAWCWDYTDARDDGWLVPVRSKVARVESLDLRSVATRGGDYTADQLNAVTKRDRVIYETALTIQSLEPRHTLVFCVGVEQAEALATILTADGIDARWICGKTPKSERREIISDFDRKNFGVLINVGCLTEGYDCPHIERIVMARPTMSDGLYRQMLGRGTRPLPGIVDLQDTSGGRIQAISQSEKPALEVVDLVGNYENSTKAVTAITALAGNYADDVVQRAEELAEQVGGDQDVEEQLQSAQKMIDDEEQLRQDAERKEREERARRLREGISFSGRVQISDADAPSQVNRLLGSGRRRQRGFYRGKRPSDRMVAVLERAGIPHDEDTTFEDASQWIGKIIERRELDLATYKQTRMLERYGYRPRDGKLLSQVKFGEAREALNKILARTKTASK